MPRMAARDGIDVSPDWRPRARKMVREGFTLQEIADIYGLAYCTVRDELKGLSQNWKPKRRHVVVLYGAREVPLLEAFDEDVEILGIID